MINVSRVCIRACNFQTTSMVFWLGEFFVCKILRITQGRLVFTIYSLSRLYAHITWHYFVFTWRTITVFHTHTTSLQWLISHNNNYPFQMARNVILMLCYDDTSQSCNRWVDEYTYAGRLWRLSRRPWIYLQSAYCGRRTRYT